MGQDRYYIYNTHTLTDMLALSQNQMLYKSQEIHVSRASDVSEESSLLMSYQIFTVILKHCENQNGFYLFLKVYKESASLQCFTIIPCFMTRDYGLQSVKKNLPSFQASSEQTHINHLKTESGSVFEVSQAFNPSIHLTF